MQGANIHPTAVIGARAILGEGVGVGPYAVIEDDVTIGARTAIGPHAVVHRFTRVGDRNRIGAHAVLGGVPQDLDFDGAETWVEIGDENIIREGVTIHRATRPASPTRLGSGCYLMAYSHVGHDCHLGDRVVLANNCMLGGHARLGDGAVLGGNTGVHQFVRVGTLAMVAGYLAVRHDVLPYTMVAGSPVRHYRLNTVGLRRAGIHGERYRALERAFRALRAGSQDLDGHTPELSVLEEWLGQPSKRGVYGFVRAQGGSRDVRPAEIVAPVSAESAYSPGAGVEPMYHRYAVQNRYGRIPDEDEHAVNYLKLLKLILSDDGELSGSKEAALDQLMDQLEIAEGIQRDVRAFDTRDVQAKDIVPALKPGGQLARLLIRDAVELSAADGVYSKKERAAVARAASELGVEEHTLGAIESLVDIERGAHALHNSLFPAPTRS